MNTLSVSEMFYSIQGEGSFQGTPSVFLRLQGCNLTCGGPDTIATGKCDASATWRCDTIDTWLSGSSHDFDSILSDWTDKGWWDFLLNGAHLVITGGEPLLHDGSLCQFLALIPPDVFIECETNGTILPSPYLMQRINQYNVSPKLANSGMPFDRRVKQDVLTAFSEHHAIFKFVVTEESDLDAIQQEFIRPFHLNSESIYLMPGVDNRDDWFKIAPRVADWAKAKGYRFSARLQVLVWNRRVGV